jgi:hypothetical protein
MATMRVFESGGCKTLTRTCIDETSKGNVDSPTPSVIFLLFYYYYLFIYLFIYFLLFFYLFLFIYLFIFFFFKLNRVCLISETLLVVSRVIWM